MEPERIREMLGADLYAQVKEKLGEKHLEIMDPQENRYVQREELEKARKAEKDAREQLQSVNGVLEGLKKRAREDADTYLAQMADMENTLKAREKEMQELQDRHREKDMSIRSMQEGLRAGEEQVKRLEKELKERQGEIRGLNRSMYERRVIEKNGARDPDLVMKLLDQSRVLEEKDGTFTGVQEQLEEMKRGAGYLFRHEIGERGGIADPVPAGPREGDVNAAIRAAFGR